MELARVEDVLNELPSDDAWHALPQRVRHDNTREALALGVIPKIVHYLADEEQQGNAVRALLHLARINRDYVTAINNELDDIVATVDIGEGWTPETHLLFSRTLEAMKSHALAPYNDKVLEVAVKLLRREDDEQRTYARVIGELMRCQWYSSVLRSPHLAGVFDYLLHSTDRQAQAILMRAFTSMSMGEPAPYLFEGGAADMLIEIMSTCDHLPLVMDAYDTARNLTIAVHACKDHFIEHGMDAILSGLEHHSTEIRQRACGLIRNIGAGDSSSDARVRRERMAEKGVIGVLLDILEQDVDDVKLSAGYAAWNITACPASANYVIENNFFPRILAIYNSVDFDKRIYGDSLKGKLVGMLCCISAHADRKHVQFLCDFGLPEILHDLMVSKNPERQPINAMLGLANLIGTIENHPLLQGDTSLFGILIECLEHARAGQQFHGAVYTEELLLPSLAKLSISDSNKQLLKDTGCVDVTCKGYRVGAKGALVDECTAKLLLNMSFAFNLEADFDMDLVALLEDIRSRSPSKEARTLAEHALFQHHQRLAGPSQGADKAETKTEDRHVLICCPAEWRPRLARLAEYLQTSGFLCHLGIADSSGDTLNAMARAVESAAVVVMCVCAEFKESASCRSESEYAQHLRRDVVFVRVEEGYEPDGWLHTLMAGRECCDLHFDNDHFAADADAIVNAVSAHCPPAKEAAKPAPDATTTSNSNTTNTTTTTSASAHDHTASDASVAALTDLLLKLQTGMETGFTSLQSTLKTLDGRVAALETDVADLKRMATENSTK
ncbi:hypothetical protein PTSG_00208 [Salpingoeca rosetta]|uniref:TIR domain-containing protein n=1 Tax=Salpingoeca rosetta (strain ATCC 50818 / BSB-021) TaxID=946362 RepID=F2TVU0_SALR5|nr:uncharacterized protein PTSG_00208 [Salpingoeca rosetta]EGD72186.1 hypothetical protein PTSG_00208 [Salpingoeca rosetta]|eukprot:XP_004998757.1 hypothetical protein PTSG_00208 [Salpingoeca rosetta]